MLILYRGQFQELRPPDLEIPAAAPPNQAVIIAVGEDQIVLTAFDVLSVAPGTRDPGTPGSTPKRPTSGPDTDPEDGDFFDY